MDNLKQIAIWDRVDWPGFFWNKKLTEPILRELHRLQGRVAGKYEAFSSEGQALIRFECCVNQILSRTNNRKNSNFAHEFEAATANILRIYPHGVNKKHPVSIEAEQQVMLSQDCEQQLTDDFNKFRIIQWHRWIIQSPEQDNLTDENIHSQARFKLDSVPKDRLDIELTKFITWFNSSRTSLSLDPLIRAAITHFWFASTCPFDSDAGALAQIMTQFALCQSDVTTARLQNMFADFNPGSDHNEKFDAYRRTLENTQHGDLDITRWVLWFLMAYKRSLLQSVRTLDTRYQQTRFWLTHHNNKLNSKQLNVLNVLLADTEQEYKFGISASQYMKIANVSKATATRHLSTLVGNNCLKRRAAGGRSTKYEIEF